MENNCDEDDNWEYVEEGPAEIIWQGNEIIVRKKKVKVPKMNVAKTRLEDVDRPTSNPLPPQSEAFDDYQNASMLSAQQMLENVAQQVPNFGTEQDKAHCPFHLKTGACRFGQRCSRVHFYPDKACTLLIKNMYNGPGLAWEQDEGLEYTDEEIERCYEEFYEDVHTEFLKYGEIVNFKVCKNGSFHLRGNVYIHYNSIEAAVLAHQSITGRYFAGKQVKCEFVNVTRWKVAICGEYMKSRLKICSHGTACNFLHPFCNPGGDYEWADWDKPPPRYWLKKMATLFGYSDEYVHERLMELGKLGQLRTSNTMVTADSDRHLARSSRSKDRTDWDTDRESRKYGHNDHSRKRSRGHIIMSKHLADYRESKNRSHDIDSDKEWSHESGNNHSRCDHTRSPGQHMKEAFLDDDDVTHNRAHGGYGYQLYEDRERKKSLNHMRRSSRSKVRPPVDVGDGKSRNDNGSPGDQSYRSKYRQKHYHHTRKTAVSQKHASESPDDRWDDTCRHHGADSGDDELDSNEGSHYSHTRKHSRHSRADSSADEAVSARRSKKKFHTGKSEGKFHSKRNRTGDDWSRRYQSSRERHGDSPVEDMELNDPHEFIHADHYDGRLETQSPNMRSSFIEKIDEQDRWDPTSTDTESIFRRKSVGVESDESDSPVEQSEYKSRDRNPVSFHDEKMDRRSRLKV